ncbi:hypothetical protein CRM22_005778 [Opisthorchis felineus]|uniref:Uncharacterized protein n=1 Tax=Opisthorchis felineus TaxID=147828 RepID=A0A4V3SER9_OPIFE|nr:hypothetical protein CRM22_005778 [Opisthorchis felineus]
MSCVHSARCQITPAAELDRVDCVEQYAINCIACMVDLVYHDHLRLPTKEAYLTAFTKFAEENASCGIKTDFQLVAKSIELLTFHLDSDNAEFSSHIVSVLKILLGILPLEDRITCHAIEPIVELLNRNRASKLCVLNAVNALSSIADSRGRHFSRTADTIIGSLKDHLLSNNDAVVGFSLYCYTSFLMASNTFQQSPLTHVELVLDVMIRSKINHGIVDNGLNCLTQIGEIPGGFKLLSSCANLSKLLRCLLTSHKEGIQHSVIKFILGLVGNESDGDWIGYMYKCGIIEFLHDLIIPHKSYLGDLMRCIDVLSNDESFERCDLIPCSLSRCLSVVTESLLSQSAIAVKYCDMLINYFSRYRGAVDIFLTPAVQRQFISTMMEMVVSRELDVHLASLLTITTAFRFDRFIRPFSPQLFASLIRAIRRRSQNYLNFCVQQVNGGGVTRSYRPYDLPYLVKIHIELCWQLHRCFFKDILETASWNAEVKTIWKTLSQMFFGRYLEIFLSVLYQKDLCFESALPLVKLLVVYLECTHTLYGAEKDNLVSSNTTYYTPDLNIEKCQCLDAVSLRQSFSYLLPLFYKIIHALQQLFRKEWEKNAKTLSAWRMSVNPSITDAQFGDLLFYRLIAFLTFTEATKFYEYESLGQLQKYITEELIWCSQLLLSGVHGLEVFEFEKLSELLGPEYSSQLDDASQATALCICCGLLNRVMVFLEPDHFTDDMEWKLPSASYFVSQSIPVSEHTLKLLASFAERVGVRYFLELPVLFTLQLMLTCNLLENITLAKIDLPPSAKSQLFLKSWNILVSALIDRMTPAHTRFLLRCPGLAERLQNADPVWIKLAQKMILQCHMDDCLYAKKTVCLLYKSYRCLSNIWTVWLSVFMRGDDVKLVERLTTTFSSMLRVLERRGEQEQTADRREARTEFAAYTLDSLQECLTNLPCSLPEFLETKDVLQEAYFTVQEGIAGLISELFDDLSSSLKWTQQILDFLTNATYAPPSRISCRLLKLILCCCTGFGHTLHLKIIKMLCTSLNSGRIGYFFSDSEATLTESPILSHCKRYRIGAEELSIIMSIGAIIVGSLELLPPNSFSDMLQAAVFTDKLMILAILKYQVPEPASAVLVQSALVCLLYSRLRKDLLWPSLHDVDFYTELTQCLHNIIMDPSEPASRFLAIRVYDALLEKVAAADNIIGGLHDFILTNPWNGIVLEQLQVVTPQDELSYPSIFLLQFVTALVKTDDPRILLIVDKKLLIDLLQMFVHGTNECLPNVMLSLRQLAEELSRANNLGLMSNTEKVSLRVKLRMEAVVGQLTSPMDVFLTQVKPKILV